MKEFSGIRSTATSPSPFGGGSGWGFRIVWRTLRRDGVFSIINIAGLSVGLTVVLLICAMIFYEYSFDKSFRDGNRIYRVNSYLTKIMVGETGISSNIFAPTSKEEIPGVEAAVRLYSQATVVKVAEMPFKVDNFSWVDEDFFRLFDRPFIYGSPEAALARPNTVAVSESMSKILFGNKNPLGETILVDHTKQLEVSAVYKDFPANSSLGNCQMVGPYTSSHLTWIYDNIGWNNLSFVSFCLLAPGTDALETEALMQQMLVKHVGKDGAYEVRLQPLERVHLYSKGFLFPTEYAPGDLGKVKMLTLLAVIILAVACINYMNLSTARAQKRSKEIGISKTLGAKRKNIVLRLYVETGILTFIAFLVAFILAWLLLPAFNSLLGQGIHAGIILNFHFVVGVLAIYVLTTLVAASYPAIYLSGFAPLTIIRQSGFIKGSNHALVRKGLTIVQFSVAVILIAWVMVIHTQVDYVSNKDIGYDAHDLIGIPMSSLSQYSGVEALKNDYMSQHSVSEAGFSSAFPFRRGNGNMLYKTLSDMQMAETDDTMAGENSIICQTTAISTEMVDLFQVKLIAGKMFPERQKGDTIIYMLLNRKAVEFLETTPEEIVGKRVPITFAKNVYVSGVIEDFHFEDLHKPIGAFGFHQARWRAGDAMDYLLLKVKDGNMSQQLAEYERIFKKHFPNDVFEPQFPSLLLAKAYEGDRQTNRAALSFSILAIIVACLGVFGLTAFMAEQRTKEIGIRKVLGASVSSIVSLFTDNYLRLLLLSLVIAVPIAWWIGSKYLESFAYRISLTWWMFVAAAVITVALTLLTVSFQAIRAATANPVKAIKSE